MISAPGFTVRPRRAFSLVEVVVAVGIFAFAVIAIIGLLLPNTRAVDEQIESDIARRLAENVQAELQRYARVLAQNQSTTARKGFDDLENAFYNGANPTRSLFMVATRDGSRVLVTGEDPYEAWNDTYADPYKPDTAPYKTVAASDKRAAENALLSAASPGNPPGIAFRDRYYLIEISLAKTPAYRRVDYSLTKPVGLGFLPVNVRVLWPYRLPNGPDALQAASQYDSYDDLPWLVVSPAKHAVFNFNLAIAP